MYLESIFAISNSANNNEARYCSCYAKSDQTTKKICRV